MKKFKMPLNAPTLYMYIGKEEWEEYVLRCSEIFNDFNIEEAIKGVPSRGEGRSTHNLIWLEELEWEVLFHEMRHFLDFMLMVKGIDVELEYRADLSAELYSSVVMWAMKEMSGEKEA